MFYFVSWKGFDDYFTRLSPLTYERNPWFIEFWQSYFDCIYAGPAIRHVRHTRTCTGIDLTNYHEVSYAGIDLEESSLFQFQEYSRFENSD